ncbi:MAG: DUF294 nucleotidyltransferase-like domain-containing protein [Desulfopila sp.]|jgi:PAS domain S-box-containing protein|nr:DUF294 nucleotidyltransferase-like domain-containing protein [Desulfopila sp.]
MILLKKAGQGWERFFVAIVLPTLIAIMLTISAIYFVIIPAFEKSFLDGKKIMIQELTKAAWSIMDFYYQEVQAGRLSQEEAQLEALKVLKTIRYGDGKKDYFWVTDSTPSLLMHPYSEELVGMDLTSFTDSSGKRLFVEIKETVEQHGSGFVDYSWNRKYSEEKTVPKLSYVEIFAPWEWVIGTGVFLDDVHIKTTQISRRLSWMSMAAVALLSLILFFVGRQSYLFEKQRSLVQQELEKSRKKYKRLVETATEPILMVFEGRCIYSNRPVQALTGLSEQELAAVSLGKILFDADTGRAFELFQNGDIHEGQIPAFLHSQSGNAIEVLLSISKMELDGREAAVINIKDTSSTKQIEKELDESREQYRRLTSRLNIGIFKAAPDSRMKLLEANHAFYDLLDREDEAQDISLEELLQNSGKPERLHDLVDSEGVLKNRIISLQKDKEHKNLSFSLVATRNAEGEILYYEGIVEDVSEKMRHEADRERLIVELQTSLLFLNQPLRHVQGEYLVSDESLSVYEAAQQMSKAQSSSLLIKNRDGDIAGIATDKAFREKVVAGKMDYDAPVSQIMSFPLIFIEDSALIFEAVTLMEEKGVKHLIVRNEAGEAVNVLSNENLLNVHRYSSASLVREIHDAATIEEIVATHKRLPRIIKSLVDSGAHAGNITRITSMVSEAVLLKCIDFAVSELGEPPARFAFICLGSEGRQEQTLVTDQDNALIFEDVEEQDSEKVTGYFLRLGEQICTWLDQIGYVFCKGKVMAMNPQWCKPISVWKEYFSAWITEAKPQDLLEVSIFFDFRCMYGEGALVQELRLHIGKRVANRDAFFHQLAQNALLFKLPLDFFGNIAVESSGEHANTFNIKHAIALIVGYARLYAINFSLEETNTLQRLDRLKTKGLLAGELHEDLTEAYNYLMQIRFKHQVERMDKGLEPDNHIPLEELNSMEKNTLKNIFVKVGGLQKKLNAIGKVEIFF